MNHMLIRMCVTLIFTLTLPRNGFASNTATIEQVKEIDLAITVGGAQSCVLEKLGVKCWGNKKHEQLNVPLLSHPQQVSAGGDHVCALDDAGVKCWGSNEYGQLNVPLLSHPREIAAGTGHSCALDDSGVKCWGRNSEGQSAAPRLTQPRNLSLGDLFSCALDDSGVKCWGDNSKGQIDVPHLSHPRQVSAGWEHACALDDSGVKCWGNNHCYGYSADDPLRSCTSNQNFGRLDVPQLSHPRQLSAGGEHACALDDSGFKCWGDLSMPWYEVPQLSNPHQVSAGGMNTCAIDDSGVKCWKYHRYGEKLQLNVPDFDFRPIYFDFFSLGNSYKNLSKYVYQDKKLVLQNLANTIEKRPINKTDEPIISYKESASRLFSMYLVESLLQETHSSFIQSKALPKLIESKNDWLKKFDISDINNIENVPDVLGVSFTAIESGLQASKNYLSGPQQKELEDLIATVALKKAVNEASSSESANQLTTALEQHQSLIATLLESERTIGFGKMILEIQNYLKGHRSL